MWHTQQMRQFVERWRRSFWIGNMLGILVFIVGMPSFFQDIGTWGHWLSSPPWLHWLRRLPLDWVADQGAWWAFLMAGLLIMFLSSFPRLLHLVGQSRLAARPGEVKVKPALESNKAERLAQDDDEPLPPEPAADRGLKARRSGYIPSCKVFSRGLVHLCLECPLPFLGLIGQTSFFSGNVQCVVFTPDGTTLTAEHPRPIEVHAAAATILAADIMLEFPTDFGGSGPLTMGEYAVEWRQENLLSFGIFSRKYSTVALTSFRIP